MQFGDSFASNLDVSLPEDLRMKPIKSLAVNGAGWFRTTRWSGALLSTQVPGSRTIGQHTMDEETHALCEALIASAALLWS
jgi:hypothetical protein